MIEVEELPALDLEAGTAQIGSAESNSVAHVFLVTETLRLIDMVT